MGTLGQTKDPHIEAYLMLGLSPEDREVAEFPLVLLALSSFIDRAVRRDELFLDSNEIKEQMTVFHGLRAPNLSIRQYIERIYKYSKCSPSCFVLALIYMDRYLKQPNLYMTSLNIHRLLLSGVVVAAKFIDDAFYNNAYYAKVGGVSTSEMNRLELDFLFSIDFRLQITTQGFGKYCMQLESVAAEYDVEWPIHGYGIRDKNSIEDTKCENTIIRSCSCRAVPGM